jgi:Cu+-exporting ATPase
MISAPPKTDLQCYHCGKNIDASPLYYEEKAFCCAGCQAVYQLLRDNALDDYYKFKERTAFENPFSGTQPDWGFLEDEKTLVKLLAFRSPSFAKAILQIPQIHCISCVWLLENLYKILPGVIKSEVNFGRKEITVSFNPNVATLRQIVEKLSRLGYCPLINLEATEKKMPAPLVDSRLLTQLGVAGFCFGNIMIFSFPEYVSLGGMAREYKYLFNSLNFLLSLPVLFYSAKDYFSAALKGLRQKIVKIEVPLALGIALMFIRSLVDILWRDGAGYFDSMAGLVFLLLVGKFFQQRTYANLSFDRDYKSYFPLGVLTLREGKECSTTIDSLQVGDKILVRNQELIPADSVLLKGQAFIDYSFVTGESEPTPVSPGELIYAGGRQCGQRIELEVVKPVAQSYLVQLWNQDSFNKKEDATQSYLLDKIAHKFTLTILALSLLSALYWLAKQEPSLALNAATAVLIIACPCALALSVPFVYGHILRILGRHQFYLKNSLVIEKITQADTIVFDKTGTLTTLKKGEITLHPTKGYISENLLSLIKSVTLHSSHPLSQEIQRQLAAYPAQSLDFFEEKVGKGLRAKIGGQQIKMGSQEWVSADQGQNVTQEAAIRVYFSAPPEAEGYFELQNNLRPGLEKMLKKLSDKFQLYLLSGDKAQDREWLKTFFPRPGQMLFLQKPIDKLNFIKRLEEKENKKVIMLGDGLNDAGALKQSHVGISVSEQIAQFTPASEAILAAGRLADLAELLQFVFTSKKVLRVCFVFSLLYNVTGLGYAVTGNASPLVAAILMPLSSITVVLLAAGLTHRYEKKYLKRQSP